MNESVLGAVAVLVALSQAPAVSHGRLRFLAATPSTMTVRQVWGEAPFRLRDARPAISPDGRHLAYASVYAESRVAGPAGSGPRPRALYVRDLLAGVSRPLTTVDSMGFVVTIHFSPDGRLVGYTWYDGVRGGDDLRRVMLDGSAAPPFPYRSDEWPHLALAGWSADGERMLMLVKTGPLASETRHMGLMSVTSGAIRILKTLALPYFPSFGFSPDARYFVVDHPVRGDAGERDIFILDIGEGLSPRYNGREARLVARPADDRQPRVTPDGTGVLFFSGATGQPISAWYQRLVHGRPQGSPELLRHNMGPDAEPIGFSSNGSFYYHIKSDSLNLRAVWVMENFLPNPQLGP